MDKILVAGIDTVIGSNLAAHLASRYQVLGLSAGHSLSIAGCETALCPDLAGDAAQQWLGTERPQWVIHCGAAARSCWSSNSNAPCDPQAIESVRQWAEAARQAHAEFCLISSDGIFTGPWMFHKESSTAYADDQSSRMIRHQEQAAFEANPEALLVRTNVFGWSPADSAAALIESLVRNLQDETASDIDCMRHATPILATDLAEILEQAYQQELRGVFHIAGAERINPFRFACLLADQFGLDPSSLRAIQTPPDQRRGFGRGETSLQCRRIRRAMEIGLPMIRDGLSRLYEQSCSGYRDRFRASELVAERVA